MAPLSLEDYGVNLILYIPKLLGQSHEKAEAMIFYCLDQLKKGDFSDELFEAIRMGELMGRIRAQSFLGDGKHRTDL